MIFKPKLIKMDPLYLINKVRGVINLAMLYLMNKIVIDLHI